MWRLSVLGITLPIALYVVHTGLAGGMLRRNRRPTAGIRPHNRPSKIGETVFSVQCQQHSANVTHHMTVLLSVQFSDLQRGIVRGSPGLLGMMDGAGCTVAASLCFGSSALRDLGAS